MNGDKFVSDNDFYVDKNRVSYKWSMSNFHYHRSYEIYYLAEGSRKMLIQDRIYELVPGDIVLLRPDVLHRSMHSGSHMRINIGFTDDFLNTYFSSAAIDYLLSCFDTEFIRLNKSEDERFNKIFRELSGAYKSNTPCFVGLAELLKLFIDAKARREREPFEKNAVSSTFSPKTNSVISYIASHYDTITSMDEIADSCYINKSYMCRLFKKETGLTVFEYINHIKIQQSCEMMKNTNDSITDIAAKCGFSSASYFSYAFKEIMDCSPSQFRKAQNKTA